MIEGNTYKRKSNAELVMVVNEDYQDDYIYYVIIKPFIQKVFKETLRDFHMNYTRISPPDVANTHKKGDLAIIFDEWTAKHFGNTLSFTGSLSYNSSDNTVNFLFKNPEDQLIWLTPDLFFWA